MAFTSAGPPLLTLEPESPEPRDWDPITMMREFDKEAYVRSPQGPPTFSPTSERRFEELASKREIDQTLPLTPIHFTGEPKTGLTKPYPKNFRIGFQEIDEVCVDANEESEQVDFSPQESSFLQRFRQCLLNSYSVNNKPPYIAIPVIAIAALSFGFE